MVKFISLEIQKHRLRGLWLGITIANLIIISLITLIFFIEKSNEVVAFPDYSVAFAAMHSFVRPTMLMFSVVLMTKLVVEEYRNKTMALMFMYPISRSRIMWYKSIMVFGFAFLTVLISNLVLDTMMVALNPIVGYMNESIDFNSLLSYYKQVLVDALVIGGMSLLPMYFGIRKFSSSASLVTGAILVVMLLTQLGGNMVFLIGTAVLGLLAAFVSVKKIERLDM